MIGVSFNVVQVLRCKGGQKGDKVRGDRRVRCRTSAVKGDLSPIRRLGIYSVRKGDRTGDP